MTYQIPAVATIDVNNVEETSSANAEGPRDAPQTRNIALGKVCHGGMTFKDTQGHYTHTHTHTTVLRPSWTFSGTTRVSRHQKGKTRKVKINLDLLEQLDPDT